VTDQTPLRVAFVPGVTIRKWTTRWQERHPRQQLEVVPLAAGEGVQAVRAHEVELSFVRLPIDREGLSVIRLYGEVPVVVVPRDHPLADAESVTLSQVPDAVDAPADVKEAVALVAAGVGYLRLPHSLARLHARKDVVAIPVSDAPETDIAIVWLADGTSDDIEEFVGIVRGRTIASSRANPTPPTPKKPVVRAPKPSRRKPQQRRRQGR
jgi:DNA-binding transcriptional LysR family regulator